MPATETNLKVEQGADYSHGWAVTFNGDPIDDTWTAKSQVRAAASSAVVLHEFDCEVTEDGAVVIGVSAAVSSAWAWRSGKYDVEVTNADESVTLRVAQGTVSVSAEVTRG